MFNPGRKAVADGNDLDDGGLKQKCIVILTQHHLSLHFTL